MRMDGAALRIPDLERAIVKVLTHAPLQLPDGEDRLHQPGRADGMPAGDQPARRVDRADRLVRSVPGHNRRLA
jgi:hypothetical protein